MNKYQESLNTIKSLLHDVCRCTAKNLPEMENNLQELVDEKTPIKAKDIKITTFHKDKDYYVGNKEFECPKCGVYQDANFNNYFNPQYCSYCGQKLDLGGNE